MPEQRPSIPLPITDMLRALERAGFEAFVVGGSVRDILLDREPKDWDITTNARPEEIQRIFPESFYENAFGTVGVKIPPFMPNGKKDREEDVVEVTTYRAESDYTDKRHPSKVSFVQTIAEDLSRRDFTMNAIALSADGALVDPFDGRADIKAKVIRAVGNPDDRFGEDALRMLRAIRFVAELRTPEPLPKDAFMEGSAIGIVRRGGDWEIESQTFSAIQNHAKDIRMIAAERVADELSKIIVSKNPAEGVDLLRVAGLLDHVLPELALGIGVGQNLHHIYSVYEHNVRALATCPSPRLDVRLAALLHDVGKPQTKRGNGYRSTFYNHDHVGARITKKLLERLRFPSKIIEKVSLLVDNHLFYYNVGEVTAASVRRLIKRVGLENMRDLMDIRIADRLGSGTPKAKPYKLRHLEYMIEKVSKDPVSVKMLAVNGRDLMGTLSIAPGPKIGAILDVLLAEVIEDPTKNTRETLLRRAESLDKEDIDHLRSLAKDRIEEKRAQDDHDVKQKHWVQ